MGPTATRRPNLLPAAALASLLVLLLGATGLFTLGYTNTRAAAALARIDALHAAQLAAVGAQVSFKTQVQEWKNLLLRGRNAADYQTYREHFEQRAADVQSGLAAVERQLAALGLEATAATRLLADHAALLQAYRQALTGYRPADPGAPFAVDAAVRGIDRKLNDDIDALAHTVEQTAAAELKALAAGATGRYAALRRVTLGASALAVLAAFWLVFQANRAARA